MGLQLILGRAGSGKTSSCLQNISRLQSEDPLGKPLILLVPEQATHNTEMILAHDLGLAGTMRAQVLSFQRLAWRILGETGGSQKMLLGEVGKRMLLKRILLKHRLEFKTLAHSAGKPGMADKLAKTIGEFKMYQIKPSQLRRVQDKVTELADKLGDLALLYETFEASVDDDTRDTDDTLSILAEKLPLADSVKKAVFWIDGFQGFTPQEFEVIRQLMLQAETVYISLTIDPHFLTNPEFSSAYPFCPGEEHFNNPLRTYQELLRIAGISDIPVLKPIVLADSWRFKHTALKHLEQSFYTLPITPYPIDPPGEMMTDVPFPNDSEFPLQIFAAANRRNEVENVALELRKLARERNWRWREMAVVSRDLPNYYALISQVFTDYQIPYFLDYKRPAQHHPLIEFILSVFEIVMSNWAYEPLFRCLKTDFFPLSRDLVDRLENYCLAHGIQADEWQQDEPLSYDISPAFFGCQDQQNETTKHREDLHRARMLVRNHFQPFVIALRQRDTFPANTITKALYSLLENLRISETLAQLADLDRKRGKVNEANLQRQIWDAVIQVLDEMVTGLGDQELSLADYSAILTSGLENIAIGLIPQGYDQVLIGALERTRIPEIRVLVILGANEGTFPGRPAPEGLLDALDRKRLAKQSFHLAPKGNVEIHEEQYLVYLALTRASEKLLISYPTCDAEGQFLKVSPAITRIKKLFPHLQEISCLEKDETIDIVSHHTPLLTHVAARLRMADPNINAPLWNAVGHWLANDLRTKNQYRSLCRSVDIQNREKPISREIARQLYGSSLKISVSRLERFAACPFAHYAGFGLKLKERSILEMSRRQIGDFCHDILYHLGAELHRQGTSWGSLNHAELRSIVENTAGILMQSSEYLSFHRTAKARYFTRRLQKTVTYAASILAELARRGEFVPIGLEVKFGPEGEFDGESISLRDGEKLILRGQIDRIDGVRVDQRVYVRIMDYKSSPTELSLDQIYHGINLQLLTYLETALNGLATGNMPIEYVPAGFIYFPVIEPKLQTAVPLSSIALEQLRSKEIKVRGYLLAEKDVLTRMDHTILSGGSEILGVKFSQKDAYNGRNKILTEEEFHILRQYLHRWLKNTGQTMLAGEIGITPYRQGNKSSCQYCSYKSVCHFDQSLPENTFRLLPKLKDDEVLAEMNDLLEHPDSQSPKNQPDRTPKTMQDINWLDDQPTIERGEV